ncbi:MAG: DtxR family Mn-dependent transcriptional regulator [Paraglaciecola sp.]
MVSQTEENYLKAIFKTCEKTEKSASTNAIAKEMQTSAASVTDMVKRLSEKKLIAYEKYKGVTLTIAGNKIATNLVRKHRLWEVFLVDKLNFSWDEVHEIAEQLEHIQSSELVKRLDQFLGIPKFDPHGDPIPDADGNFTFRKQVLLSELPLETEGVVVGVQEHSTQFLQYLDKMNLGLGATIKVIEKFEYDESLKVEINQQTTFVLSNKVSQNLFVQEKK